MENSIKGGPKTDTGKEISKMNALKHGLLSKEILLKDDNSALLEELAGGICEVFQPIGRMEELLVDRIISNMWRLRRAMQVERGTMEWYKSYDDAFGMMGIGGNEEAKKLKEMLDNGAIEKIIRYENAIERGIFKALHELERLQARRNGEKPPLPVPVDIDVQNNE